MIVPFWHIMASKYPRFVKAQVAFWGKQTTLNALKLCVDFAMIWRQKKYSRTLG